MGWCYQVEKALVVGVRGRRHAHLLLHCVRALAPLRTASSRSSGSSGSAAAFLALGRHCLRGRGGGRGGVGGRLFVGELLGGVGQLLRVDERGERALPQHEEQPRQTRRRAVHLRRPHRHTQRHTETHKRVIWCRQTDRCKGAEATRPHAHGHKGNHDHNSVVRWMEASCYLATSSHGGASLCLRVRIRVLVVVSIASSRGRGGGLQLGDGAAEGGEQGRHRGRQHLHAGEDG